MDSKSSRASFQKNNRLLMRNRQNKAHHEIRHIFRVQGVPFPAEERQRCLLHTCPYDGIIITNKNSYKGKYRFNQINLFI